MGYLEIASQKQLDLLIGQYIPCCREYICEFALSLALFFNPKDKIKLKWFTMQFMGEDKSMTR